MRQDMGRRAVVLTNGLFTTSDAKTAHGLVRGTDRFRICGVVDDPRHAGMDAGRLLDGRDRGIPVFGSLEEALGRLDGLHWIIVGIATMGGRLPQDMREVLRKAMEAGLSVVNGLHECLSDLPEFSALAAARGVEIMDIRKPKPRSGLHFWSGAINTVQARVIAVFGMDCAMGKRTLARMLTQACNREGMPAEMIYTGQTGWMQGGRHGFILDSTLNDFVSGELEHAIVECWKETGAEWIFLEGQSSLRNPSGPCGAEFIASGNARHCLLLVAPKRVYYEHEPHIGAIPEVESEIALIRLLGAEVVALALNTEGCSQDEVRHWKAEYARRTGLPVVAPLEEGVDALLPVLRNLPPKSQP